MYPLKRQTDQSLTSLPMMQAGLGMQFTHAMKQIFFAWRSSYYSVWWQTLLSLITIYQGNYVNKSIFCLLSDKVTWAIFTTLYNGSAFKFFYPLSIVRVKRTDWWLKFHLTNQSVYNIFHNDKNTGNNNNNSRNQLVDMSKFAIQNF